MSVPEHGGKPTKRETVHGRNTDTRGIHTAEGRGCAKNEVVTRYAWVKVNGAVRPAGSAHCHVQAPPKWQRAAGWPPDGRCYFSCSSC